MEKFTFAYHSPDTPGAPILRDEIEDKTIQKKAVSQRNLETEVEKKKFTKKDALDLIKEGNVQGLIENINEFKGLDEEIVLKMIDEGYSEYVFDFLNKVKDFPFNKDTAIKLIEPDSWYLPRFDEDRTRDASSAYVFNNPDKFGIIFNEETALELIKGGRSFAVDKYIDKFSNLGKEVAVELIRGRFSCDCVFNHTEKFNLILDKQFFLELLNYGQDYMLDVLCSYGHLNKFVGLDQEIAIKVLENKHYAADVFSGNNFNLNFDKKFAIELIDKGYGSYVIDYFDKFEGLTLDKELALHLVPHDWQYLLNNLDRFSGLNTDENCIELVNCLLKNGEVFGESDRLKQNFIEGEQIFGATKMLRYLSGNKKVSVHDVLYNFAYLIDLYKLSGLSSQEFYSNILNQVSRDDSLYEEGTAYHHLNAIIGEIDDDLKNHTIAQNLELAKEYGSLKNLTKLVEELSQPKTVISSWLNIKKYVELKDLLKRKDILNKLEELEDNGQNKLADYMETLAFHTDSKVNLNEVLSFGFTPEIFLANGDLHTPDDLQESKKPSNYTEIDNLDLSASQLRDAIIDGTIDKISAFHSFQIEYTIIPGQRKTDLRNEIKEALGSLKTNIPGKAQNARALFKKLDNYFKSQGLSFNEYLNGNQNLDNNTQNELRSFLYEKNIGLPLPKELIKMRALIGEKSDPQTILAGDDTVNCMPFGSGKNNVYMFNPNTAYFLVQIKRNFDNWKTIAQSVLTKDVDVHKPVSEILNDLRVKGEKLNEIIPEEILNQQTNYIACDNVEVNPNAKNYLSAIEGAYLDFFNEYLQHYSKEDHLNKDRVIVGPGYSDALTNLPLIKNTYLPLAPVSYSDNLRSESLCLDVIADTSLEILSKKVTLIQKPGLVKKMDLNDKIQPLTYEDSLRAAYLEGKAYADNSDFMVYLSGIENTLIAKDINNIQKGRPNLSFKYCNNNGKIGGYILAYEGIKGINDNTEGEKEPVIYVADLASDKNSPLAGGTLIEIFLQAYKENYLDKDNPLPIYAEMREATSYQLILNHLKSLSKKMGVSFQLEELGSYSIGADTMHRVIIRQKKN